MRGKGQVSLEFLFVFAIMVILLAYSVNNTTFQSGSTSVETLKIQTALEAKNVANRIAGAISQTYSQGPGSKTTIYIKTSLLADPNTLQKTFGSSKITIAHSEKSIQITIGDTSITSGENKNTFSTITLYNTTSTSSKYTFNNGLPRMLTVVVEWNPDLPESWDFDSTKNELVININPGG